MLSGRPIRSFIALEIPDWAREAIGTAVDPLKKSMPEVKWVEADHLHLTMKFLGNAELSRLDLLKVELSDTLISEKRFSIQFSKIGAFPGSEDPKIIWLGVESGRDCLNALARKIEEASFRVGFQREDRPFAAHLTLGRVREGKNIRRKAGILADVKFSLNPPVTLDRLTVFKSVLLFQGPFYERLFGLSLH